MLEKPLCDLMKESPTKSDWTKKGSRKAGFLIIDESDAPMFNDLDVFYKNTKAQNLKVICLTATAFDGIEEGNELKAIDLMGY